MLLKSLILTLLASSFIWADTLKSLTCERDTDAQLRPIEIWTLKKNVNEESYTLKFFGRQRYLGGDAEVSATLASKLTCVSSGEVSNPIISCQYLEVLPINPAIRGPSGSIQHKFEIKENKKSFINDKGITETEVSRSFFYSRSQQMWAALLELDLKTERGERG